MPPRASGPPASSHLGASLPEIDNLYLYPSICVFPPFQIWLQYTICIFICVTVFVHTCIFVFRITHSMPLRASGPPASSHLGASLPETHNLNLYLSICIFANIPLLHNKLQAFLK